MQAEADRHQPQTQLRRAEMAETRLHWEVKDSLRRYVTGFDGTRTIHSPALIVDGELVFPSEAEQNHHFAGGVLFEGHNGQLRIEIMAPALITGVDGRRHLRVKHRGNEILLADLEALLEGDGGFTAIPYLRAEGLHVFGGFYPVGTALDELTVRYARRLS